MLISCLGSGALPLKGAADERCSARQRPGFAGELQAPQGHQLSLRGRQSRSALLHLELQRLHAGTQAKHLFLFPHSVEPAGMPGPSAALGWLSAGTAVATVLCTLELGTEAVDDLVALPARQGKRQHVGQGVDTVALRACVRVCPRTAWSLHGSES